MPITDFDRHIIYSGIVFFNVVGLFGNFNVLYAHYRLTKLRTKYGLLLAMLVTSHAFCLLYELVGLVYDVFGAPIIRHTCFYILSPYIFTFCLQVALMAAISTDMLISIAFPLQHRMLRMRTYLTILVLPGIIYGVAVLITGVIYTNERQLKLCNLPTSLPFKVMKMWHLAGLVFTVVTIFSYLAAYTILYRKYKNNIIAKLHSDNKSIERKALKSLSILIVVFIIERLFFTSLINYLDFAGHSKDVLEKAQAYMVFSSLTVYSSTYYVCFARSSEYRRIFWRQIVKMIGCFGVKLQEDRFGHSSTEDLRKHVRHNKFQPNESYGSLSGGHPSTPKF